MKTFLGIRIMPQPSMQERIAQRQMCGESLARLADNLDLPRCERNRLADEAMKWMTTKPPKYNDFLGLYS